MDPLTLKLIWILMGVVGLGLAGIIILAAINAHQKMELMTAQLRLQNLRMMKSFDNIGKEKK